MSFLQQLNILSVLLKGTVVKKGNSTSKLNECFFFRNVYSKNIPDIVFKETLICDNNRTFLKYSYSKSFYELTSVCSHTITNI